MAEDTLSEYRSTEELLAHQKEVVAELGALNEEFNGKPFPAEARERFAELKKENDEIDKRVAEFTARADYLTKISRDKRHVEPADDVFKPRRQEERRAEDIFDLTHVRIDVGNPERGQRDLRDRAMRALEIISPVHPDITRERAQDIVTRLLDHDTPDGALAQRILRTGNPVYRRAWQKWAFGMQLNPEEQRAFSLSTTGIPIPYTLDPTVIPVSSSVVNPVRAISRKVQLVGSNEWRGVTAGAITASRVAEGTEATDNTPTLAQPIIPTSKAHCFVPFSIESGQDWVGMEAELARLIADAKDDEEATAFVNGNGTPPNPQGVVVGSTGTTAASTGLTITAANLYSLEGALAPRFRPRAQFMANRAMYNIIRALDTAGGAQLWLRIGDLIVNEPASSGGVGNTGLRLLGYPVNECSTMPATVTNGTKVMLLGDFSMYVIVDRVGMTSELVPHLFGATNRYPTGQRGIYAYWRNGGEVIDPVGFRALTGTT